MVLFFLKFLIFPHSYIYDIIDIVFCRKFWFMRIMKSKATDPTYHVIQDVKRD